MKIRTLVLMAVILCSVQMQAWFGALASVPRMFGSAIGFVAMGTGKTALWALEHPVVTVGVTCAVLYADKNLRDKLCRTAHYLFDKYSQWAPESRIVKAVGFAGSAYHFFNPTQQEQAAKEEEKKQVEQRAHELENQVHAHQKQNEALSIQLNEVHSQVKDLSGQLAVARDTQKSMTELSGSFEQLTKKVDIMNATLGNDQAGLVATMGGVSNHLRELAGTVRGLDDHMSLQIKNCLSDVQKLLDKAYAVKAQEQRQQSSTIGLPGQTTNT